MQLNIDICILIDICISNVCINMNQPKQIADSQFGILPWNTSIRLRYRYLYWDIK